MNHSTKWSGKTSLIIIDIEETDGSYTGLVQLFSNGKKIGAWTGGNYDKYNVGYSWDTLERAINSLSVFMTWEYDAQVIAGTVEPDQDLLEDLCHGRARAKSHQVEVRKEYDQDCEEENLIADLEEGRELIAASIDELSIPVIVDPVHEAGEQLGLF